jgi:uncharacterized protein
MSSPRLDPPASAFACGAALPATQAEGANWQPVVLPQAQQRDFLSAITEQHYRIFVHIPKGNVPDGGHPVLFALDGNATFPTLALMARTAGGRGRPAPVVVGIGYARDEDFVPARSRDYTPPTGAQGPAGEGGADLFLDFIERELKPLVAALAPLDLARQALFGHSYGGLLALHALFTRPAMFQTWLAASPSIWYEERAVLSALPGLAQRLACLADRRALLLTVGEFEQPAGDPARLQGRQQLSAQRRQVDAARELAAQLQADGLLARVEFDLLEGENHGSAMYPALARGLEFFLGREGGSR